ncbi:MAG: hypothetical protein Q4E07_04330 [Eubacteriales bacterium]|nr:hypothetical protein [Eubacteriales bacterium]
MYKDKIIAALLFVLCLFTVFSAFADEKPIRVHYFYSEICESCDEEEKFISFFKSQTENIKRRMDIAAYNVFKSSELYLKTLGELNILEEEIKLPVLVINDTVISTKEDIIKRTPAVIEKEILGNAYVLDYYYKSKCPYCVKVEEALKTAQDKYPLVWDYINCDQTFMQKKFHERLTKREVPNNIWYVPFLFTEQSYLTGSDNILENADAFAAELYEAAKNNKENKND